MPVGQGWRFPIFWKILVSCLVLATAIIVGSWAYTKYMVGRAAATRQTYLDKHLKRYRKYQEDVGAAISSVADVVAGELAPQMGGPPETARQRAGEVFDRLSGKRGIRPDLFVVFDAGGEVVYVNEGSGIKPGDLREMEAAARVRTGTSFFNQLVVENGRAYLAAGVPMPAAQGGTSPGGLIVGVAIERYFREFKVQSDDDEMRQHWLALIDDGKVISSVFPSEKWDRLAEALKPNRRKEVRDQRGAKVPVVDFDKLFWDFHETEIAGLTGAEKKDFKIYILRTRSDVRPNESFTVPVVIGVGFSVLVALLMAMWLTRPIKQFIRATGAIAAGTGDLTKRIEVASNDEIGDLAQNLNQLFGNLHELAHEVQQASFQVGASSAEISAASKQMLDGAKDQAVKIEGSTAAVTELSSSIQQVASNAIEATKVAQQSNTAVSAAIDSMNHIRSTVEEAGEKIQDLGESGKRIGNIVEVIRQISEQTSLLALNASIEAAHAGEQGRGFAVVADEVSSLARRVGQSAKDIEDLIATIKDQTAAAVSAMQAGTRDVEKGTEQVTSTLGNLKQIIDVVQDTANAVQEQAIVSDEIARNMDAVQKIAHEVLASSEEAVVQGEQLHNLAHALEESVRGFNIDGAEEDAVIAARRRTERSPHAEAARPALPPQRANDGQKRLAEGKAAAGGRSGSKPRPGARG